MKLEELIKNSDLDMTYPQVKAFMLGIHCADRPMPFNKAMDELFSEIPEARAEMESELKNLWDETHSKRQVELANMFTETPDLKDWLETSKEQLDYFLTAMSLSGTNVETSENDELTAIIDELEDTIMDMDEYLSEEKPSPEEGEEIKEFLIGTWNDFIEARR